MKRIKIDSSELKSVGYDEDKRVLEAEFSNGKVYRYTQVPKEIYDDLMKSDSHGRYFNKHIRDKFEFLKEEFKEDVRELKRDLGIGREREGTISRGDMDTGNMGRSDRPRA